MNAYELAKELDACFTRADWNVLEAATMLRQQADRIAELEKQIEPLTRLLEAQTKMHETAVAMLEPALVIGAQTKPLSDEEMLEMWDWDSGEILATDLIDFGTAIQERILGK